jgi:hypothetical protein
MKYTEEELQYLNKSFINVHSIYSKIVRKIIDVEKSLKNPKAREYLVHGVKRRIDIINRCIENIFEIYQPNRKELLDIGLIEDLDINLHAFLINIYGVIENLGLFMAYENNLINPLRPEKKQRNDIGLYKKIFYTKLNKTLEDYFSHNNSRRWYEEYAKNYRDALAHRIPPYIPPMEVNEESIKNIKELDEKINNFKITKSNYDYFHKLLWQRWTFGSPANYFLHSFSEKSGKVLLHMQIIHDMITIEEIIFTVLDNIYK